MSAKPRCGETVLHNILKTVKRGKSEPSWSHGVWIGSIETSDEHLVATEMGVIKARAVTGVMESKRFDAKSINTDRRSAMEALDETPRLQDKNTHRRI